MNLFQEIAPARALGIQLSRFANGRAELVAPFAPNRNDKGTAFAGSIASMLTLAGWAAITLSLKEAGVAADVMVVKSDIDYVSPARGALFAEAEVSPEEMKRVIQEVNARGKSRANLNATLHSEGVERATLAASYAVVLSSLR